MQFPDKSNKTKKIMQSKIYQGVWSQPPCGYKKIETRTKRVKKQTQELERKL